MGFDDLRRSALRGDKLPITFFALVAAMKPEETLARCIIKRHVCLIADPEPYSEIR
jgi:hypothetical protein